MIMAYAHDGVMNANLGAVMIELRAFVSSIQKPELSSASWANSMRLRGEKLAQRICVIYEELSDKQKESTRSLEKIAVTLKDYSTELNGSRQLKKLHSKYLLLSRYYEELMFHLRDLKLVGERDLSRTDYLRPVNYTRNIFHACMGLFGVLMYEFVITYNQVVIILLSLVTVFASLEITRRRWRRWNDFLLDRVFHRFARPSERYYVNASTYYLLSMTLIAIIFPKPVAQLAILILAFADPTATITGKLWGKNKLFRNKSYVGTGLFFAVGLVVTLTFFILAMPQLSMGYALFAALVLAAVGTATELFSYRIDDNFSIPIVCAITAFLLL